MSAYTSNGKRTLLGCLTAVAMMATLTTQATAQCACNADVGGGGWTNRCNAEYDNLVCSTREDCMNGEECVQCAVPPDGIVDFNDFEVMIQAATGANTYSCGGANFDVNCDGHVDFEDLGAVVCVWQAGQDCCNAPKGACCKPGGPCVQTTAFVCALDQPPGIGAGVYLGDGTTCGDGPCDCVFDSIPDACEVDCSIPGCDQGPCGWAEDCNGNLQPDQCEFGACCVTNDDGTQGCTVDLKENCLLAAGTWRGPCAECPQQNAAIIEEPGGDIFVHIIGSSGECPPEGRAPLRSRAACTEGPFTDVWVSGDPTGGTQMCHNFGSASTVPVPADFFGSGSDAFDGIVCLHGVPLGIQEYGDADTLVQRSADPFSRCDMTLNVPSTVDVDVVALSLASDNPITVTYNSGQDPELWDVTVDLSPNGTVPGTPQGTLTATKRHCNGGTYTSVLYVQPRFTFTKVGDPNRTEVLDTFDAGMNAVPLIQSRELWWVSELDPDMGILGDACTDFHPSVIQTIQQTVDCQPSPSCFISTPLPAPPPYDVLKNRYLSIVPNNPVIGAFDIKVTMASSEVIGTTGIGRSWWAQAPDADCLSIVSPTPPASAPDWSQCPVAHLTGCPILPTSVYDIVAVDGLAESFPPLTMRTIFRPNLKWWGDTVGFFNGVAWTPPQGVTNIDDAVAAIKTWQNPGGVNATHVSVTDVHPNLNGTQINRIVNFDDVFSLILAFQGNEYPGPDVMQCTDP